jgi:hypothetical protein
MGEGEGGDLHQRLLCSVEEEDDRVTEGGPSGEGSDCLEHTRDTNKVIRTTRAPTHCVIMCIDQNRMRLLLSRDGPPLPTHPRHHIGDIIVDLLVMRAREGRCLHSLRLQGSPDRNWRRDVAPQSPEQHQRPQLI